MQTTAPNVSRDIYQAARRGEASALWTVYENFYAYAKEYQLAESQHHEFLRQAMQAGNRDAQFEVAKLLRGGWLSFASDDTLRVVNQQPTQDDLDRARELVNLAAGQGQETAQHMLDNLPEAEWNARTVHRSPFGVHANLIRNPLEETEEAQVTPASTHYLWYALAALAVLVVLWAAWALYSAKLAQV